MLTYGGVEFGSAMLARWGRWLGHAEIVGDVPPLMPSRDRASALWPASSPALRRGGTTSGGDTGGATSGHGTGGATCRHGTGGATSGHDTGGVTSNHDTGGIEPGYEADGEPREVLRA